MSTPVGKRGEPDYIEQPKASKKVRVQPPRAVKLAAIAKTRMQLKAEAKAAQKGRSIEKNRRVKRERPQEAQVEHQAAGQNPFSRLTRGVVQKILGDEVLTPIDLQHARVDTYLNRQVAEKVREADINILLNFKNFLVSNLPELAEAFPTIDAIRAASTASIDNPKALSYFVRSSLIDILATLSPERVTALEEAFRLSGNSFPPGFSTIFTLVRLQVKNLADIDTARLTALGELYERVRLMHKTMTAEERANHGALVHIIFRELEYSGMLGLLDRPTFALLEQLIETFVDKHNDLMEVYTYAAVHEIAHDHYDKGLQLLSKLLELVHKPPFQSHHLAYFFPLHTVIMRTVLRGSEVGAGYNHAIDKIFDLFENAARDCPEKDKNRLLRLITGLKIVAYCVTNRREELRSLLGNTLERLEKVFDAPTKLQRLKDIMMSTDTYGHLLIEHVKAAKDSDSKAAMMYYLTRGSNWLNAIRDPEFKKLVEKSH